MLKAFSKIFSNTVVNTTVAPQIAPTLATNKKHKEQQALDAFIILRRAQASVQFLLVDGENNSNGFTPSHSDVLYMLDSIAENLAQLEEVVANGGSCE